MSVFNKIRPLPRRFQKWLLLAALLALVSLVVLGILARRHFNSAINDEAARQIAAARVEVSATPGTHLNVAGMQLSLAAVEARALSRYRDVYYAATAGGLLAFDGNGKLLNHYTILEGLPSLDLIALAVYHGRLYIGSADSGLIAFDGQDFTHYQFQKPAIKQI